MSNPYQAPNSRIPEPPKPRLRSALSVALICFVGGYLVPILLFFAIPAPKSCPPPCDGPAMLLAGLVLFIGPVVGVVSALIGFFARMCYVAGYGLRPNKSFKPNPLRGSA
jgi:hypothetical protein